MQISTSSTMAFELVHFSRVKNATSSQQQAAHENTQAQMLGLGRVPGERSKHREKNTWGNHTGWENQIWLSWFINHNITPSN